MNLSFPSDTPSYFADAESSFNDAAFVLYGVPYEQTVTFRKGTKQGPMQIRKASWNFESFNPHTTIDLQDIQIHDYGNLPSIEKVSSEEMIQRVKTFTKTIVQQNKTPIAL
ncbi:MAG: arginase family protein, partial [Thermoplasmatota archaeon]